MAGSNTTTDRGTVVLVDGFGLIFRAYYALPTTMTTAEGEQTNAVYGFASMLLDVLRTRDPEYAVIALETGQTFRHELYPDYKGTRAAMPEDLRSQLDRVNELIDAFNIPVQKKDLYEADDVIGTLSRELAAQGHKSSLSQATRTFSSLWGTTSSSSCREHGASESSASSTRMRSSSAMGSVPSSYRTTRHSSAIPRTTFQACRGSATRRRRT